jgi:hypothetical protein
MSLHSFVGGLTPFLQRQESVAIAPIEQAPKPLAEDISKPWKPIPRTKQDKPPQGFRNMSLYCY